MVVSKRIMVSLFIGGGPHLSICKCNNCYTKQGLLSDQEVKNCANMKSILISPSWNCWASLVSVFENLHIYFFSHFKCNLYVLQSYSPIECLIWGWVMYKYYYKLFLLVCGCVWEQRRKIMLELCSLWAQFTLFYNFLKNNY